MISPIIIWLALGVAFFIADKFTTKYNLVYASYAAFTIAAFLITGIMRMPEGEAQEYYEYFIIAEIICFVVGIFAWKYVFRDVDANAGMSPEDKEFYKSIKDKTVEVAPGGINSISGGSVVFAGKTLKARFAPNADSESVEAGAKMLVKEVDGDTVIVTPK
ncbi:MAG: hypothetical protein ABL867_00755 [Rickettsiales bacterium]